MLRKGQIETVTLNIIILSSLCKVNCVFKDILSCIKKNIYTHYDKATAKETQTTAMKLKQ